MAEGLFLPNMLMRQPNGGHIPIEFLADLDTMFCVRMKEKATLETWKQNTDLKPRFCRLLKPSNKREADSLYYSATRAKKKLTAFLFISMDHSYLSLEASEDSAATLLQMRELPLNEDCVLAGVSIGPRKSTNGGKGVAHQTGQAVS